MLLYRIGLECEFHRGYLCRAGRVFTFRESNDRNYLMVYPLSFQYPRGGSITLNGLYCMYSSYGIKCVCRYNHICEKIGLYAYKIQITNDDFHIEELITTIKKIQITNDALNPME